jgi:hypothetical protein
MPQNNWIRAHLRAPVYSEALITKEHYVVPGYAANISEGGCLLYSAEPKNDNDVFSVMFLLTHYPDFSQLIRSDLFSLNRGMLKNTAVRGKVVVRRNAPANIPDFPFPHLHGCKFLNITKEEKDIIDTYVKRYARNIVFVLNLFEGMDVNNSNVSLIRSLTRFLGYSSDMKLPFVRQKLLHDYQSLETGFRLSGI